MERRIRLLYLLTIAAIVVFLAMQTHWLYTRYIFSLQESEQSVQARVVDALRVFTGARLHSFQEPVHLLAERGMSMNMVDSTRPYYVRRAARINVHSHFPNRGAPEAGDTVPRPRRYKFEATNAPSEGAVWAALDKVETEHLVPLAASETDSVLRRAGIRGGVRLVRTDSMEWAPVVVSAGSLLRPRIIVRYPYSELQQRSVEVDCEVPTKDILRRMAWSLLGAGLVSVFLILCLIWQFATVLRLTRIDRLRSGFTAAMIHELKRPVSTLKMCVAAIESPAMMASSESRAQIGASSRRALDSLSAYFSKLRDLTFNRTDQIPLTLAPVRLNDLAATATAMTLVPTGRTLSVENEIDPDLTITADRSHILNILLNLLENAVKYAGPDARVRISAEPTPEGVCIRVADAGPGIPRRDLDRIFTRFFRGAAATSAQPGMGLGLAYVRMLAEAHGGTARVESTEGEGATFIITLPQ